MVDTAQVGEERARETIETLNTNFLNHISDQGQLKKIAVAKIKKNCHDLVSVDLVNEFYIQSR